MVLVETIMLILILIMVLSLMITMMVQFFLTKVPYVPTSKGLIKAILNKLNLQADQNVYDLGCGDGRFIFESEKKFQTNGTGYEVSPVPFLQAQLNRLFKGFKSKVYFENFLNSNLSDADLIFCYLFPEPMKAVAEKINKECRKGTTLVSNTFQLKDREPDQIIQHKKQKAYIYHF